MNLVLEQTLPLFKEGPHHRAVLVLLVKASSHPNVHHLQTSTGQSPGKS